MLLSTLFMIRKVLLIIDRSLDPQIVHFGMDDRSVNVGVEFAHPFLYQSENKKRIRSLLET